MIRDDQGFEMSEILAGESFQADEAEETWSVAVSGGQVEVRENV